MFKFWPKHQPIFSITPSQFTLYDIWRQGFKAALPVWLYLLGADLIFIVVIYTMDWMPYLGKIFPILEKFRIDPTIFYHNKVSQSFAILSQLFLPFLFWLFISIPVYLGLHLIALRIAYQKTFSYRLLMEYIGFYWWSVIVHVSFLSGFIILPVVYGMRFLFTYFVIASHALPQFYVGTALLILFLTVMVTFGCFSLNLIFMGHLKVIDGIALSFRAVKIHFWKILGMLVIIHLTRVLSFKTHFLSDILLMPPTYMAWALLYKNIFGEKGLNAFR